jgi:hypothetical protein
MLATHGNFPYQLEVQHCVVLLTGLSVCVKSASVRYLDSLRKVREKLECEIFRLFA